MDRQRLKEVEDTALYFRIQTGKTHHAFYKETHKQQGYPG